jgi:hypothetical protein
MQQAQVSIPVNGKEGATAAYLPMYSTANNERTKTSTPNYNMKYYLMSLLQTKILAIAWFLAPIMAWVEKFILSDLEFYGFIVVICVANAILGLIKYIKAGKVNTNGFFTLFLKLLTYLMVYLVLLIIIHGAVNFKVNGAIITVFSWVNYVIYSAIIAQELLTALRNTAELGIFVAPKWIIARLENFNDEGKAVETPAKTLGNDINQNGNAH